MHASNDPPGQSAGGAGLGGGMGVGAGGAPMEPLVTKPSDVSCPISSFNQQALPSLGTKVQPTQPSRCWHWSQQSVSLVHALQKNPCCGRCCSLLGCTCR